MRTMDALTVLWILSCWILALNAMVRGRGPVTDIWNGIKRAVEWALDPVFGFSRRAEQRRQMHDMSFLLKQLQEENAKLKEAQRLLLDGVPGSTSDPVPAWGSTPTQGASMSAPAPMLAPDRRYIARLERDRDKAQREAVEAKELAERAMTEIGRLSRRLASEQGYLVAQAYGEADPVAVLDDAWNDRYQQKMRDLRRVKADAERLSTKWGVVNRIVHEFDDRKTYDVFIEFDAPDISLARAIAEKAMRLQCIKDSCTPYEDTLQMDVSSSPNFGSDAATYRFRYRCVPAHIY